MPWIERTKLEHDKQEMCPSESNVTIRVRDLTEIQAGKLAAYLNDETINFLQVIGKQTKNPTITMNGAT